jgi:hypothetical protein
MDRGPECLQVLWCVIALKVAFPDHVTLLRGNHEEDLEPPKLTNEAFEKECDNAWHDPEATKSVMGSIFARGTLDAEPGGGRLFSWLPLAARVRPLPSMHAELICLILEAAPVHRWVLTSSPSTRGSGRP